MKRCSWPGCKYEIEAWQWGCTSHWRALPYDIREKIQLKKPGAAQSALAWIRTTLTDVQEKARKDWNTLIRMVRDRDAARKRRLTDEDS